MEDKKLLPRLKEFLKRRILWTIQTEGGIEKIRCPFCGWDGLANSPIAPGCQYCHDSHPRL